MFIQLFQLSKDKQFIFLNLTTVFIFAFIYYFMHSIESNSPSKYSFREWLHFSLITQTTVGYSDPLILGPITIWVNFIQLILIFAIMGLSLQ